MAQINVYLFEECDYVATPWEIEETLGWYNELTGVSVAKGYAELIDQKSEGMWDEISIEEAMGKVVTGDKIFGNLGYINGQLCVCRSFNDVVKGMEDMSEPEIIASTEY